jgi:transposase
LARLLRASELTAVWVPDEIHEAIRDLVRTKAIAGEDDRRKRQHVSSFLLRHGRFYHAKASWRGRHLRWLDGQSLAHPAQRLAYQELLNAVQTAADRIERIEAALIEFVPQWTMAPVVTAFQALRGVAFSTATTLVAELGDLRRFDHPRHLMAFLGLVPSERSTGETRRQGGITKTGNVSPRTALVEAAWTYRHSAGLGVAHQRRQLGLPQTIREIAWKAQTRLCALPAPDGQRQASYRGHDCDRTCQKDAKPLVEALQAWLDLQLSRLPGRSRLAEAIRYALGTVVGADPVPGRRTHRPGHGCV